MIKEIFDYQPSINIDPAEYVRLLGYPIDHELDDRPKELAELTVEWFKKHGKPWLYFKQVEKFELHDDQFVLENISFESRAVLDRFKNGHAQGVYLAAASAGKECEEKANLLWKENKPDEYYFMEMYGSAVVENLIMQVSAQLCAMAEDKKSAVLPHYSPGYDKWDILDQLKLIKLIKDGNTTSKKLLIESLDSGMLKPKKSLLAIFGITDEPSKLTTYPGMVPCEKCALKGCNYRRKRYRFSKQNQLIENQ